MKDARVKRISAIVLAAGLSKRMGQNKLLMHVNGKSMLSHTLDLVETIGFSEKILVISRETAAATCIPKGFITVINDNPEKGQALSLRLGLLAATLDHYMFFLADMPLLRECDALRIISMIGDGKIIVPESGGAALNPVVFPKNFRRELLAAEGDKGGRDIIAAHKDDCRAVVFENRKAFEDIDTPENLSSIFSHPPFRQI